MNKEIRFKFDWLVWFILLLPTFYIVNKDLRHVQMNFFQISIILMLAVLHVNRWIGLFIGWAAFQILFFSEAPNKSLILQNLFFAGVLYHFIVKYTLEFKRYFWALFALLGINVFWSGFQMFQFDPVFSLTGTAWMNHHNMRLFFSEYPGFFGIPSFFGNFAAAMLPICFVLCPAFAIYSVFGLLVSKSSFSIIGAAVGFLFFMWYRKRLAFWGCLIACILFGSVYVLMFDAPSGQFSRRLNVWRLILQEGFRQQYFGHGIGTYHSKYTFVETSPNHAVAMVRNNRELAEFVIASAIEMKKTEVVKALSGQDVNSIDFEKLRFFIRDNLMDVEVWDSAHNEFLQVFFETGFLGFIILIGYILNIFRRFFSVTMKDQELVALMASFISICIVSFAHFPFHVARLAGPFIVIMALLETKLLRSENAD